MNNETLKELIEMINNIYYDSQYDTINECMKLLGITISDYEKEEFSNNLPFYIEDKDCYAKRIIEETEKRLSVEQLELFYKSLSPTYVRFTNNNSLKINNLNKLIDKNKHVDYDGNVEYFIIKLVNSINDDNYKIDFISKYKDILDTEQLGIILSTLNSDELKLRYLNDLTEDFEGFSYVLLSLKDDNKKFELYEQYKEELNDYINYKDIVISSNNNELKLQLLDKIKYNSSSNTFYKTILSMDDEETLMKLWDKIDLEDRGIIIYKVKDLEKKVELIKRLNKELEDNNKTTTIEDLDKIIYELPIDFIKSLIIECPNIKIDAIELGKIITKVNDDNWTIEVFSIRNNKHLSRHIRFHNLLSSNMIINNIDLFLEAENVNDKEIIKKYMEELYIKNNDIVYTIDWRILDNKYVNTLGLDKINVIASFRELTDLVLKLDDCDYEAFYRTLNYYIEKNGDVDWQYAAYQIMNELYFNNVDHKKITNYIKDFNNINMDNLLYILLNGHEVVDINSEDDINNYDKLIKEKCDYNIINGTLDEKKDAIFIKYFGLSDKASMLLGFRRHIKNGMFRIYRMYHKDINLIEDEEIKELFSFLDKVINSNSLEELLEIYNSKNEFEHVDTYKIERLIKNEILKLYNKELLQLSYLKQNEDGLYEAGTDFKIIATSIGAYYQNNPDNYKDSWNTPSLVSQHFCASFIRNDMLGTAPVPHFMYGFTSMEPYSLLLAGPTDIASTSKSFVSKSFEKEEYLSPDNFINKTTDNRQYKYNEMDFRRISNGIKKQPDYILIFKRDGEISGLDEAKKASSDWNGLPIVVIDVDLCLKSEKDKLNNLLEEYYANPNNELYEMIKTKIMNNRITDASFASEIDLKELKNMSIKEDSEQVLK